MLILNIRNKYSQIYRQVHKKFLILIFYVEKIELRGNEKLEGREHNNTDLEGKYRGGGGVNSFYKYIH